MGWSYGLTPESLQNRDRREATDPNHRVSRFFGYYELLLELGVLVEGYLSERSKGPECLSGPRTISAHREHFLVTIAIINL